MKRLLLQIYKIPKKIRNAIRFCIQYMFLSSCFIVTWEQFFPAKHIFVSIFLLLSNIIAIVFIIKTVHNPQDFSIEPDIKKAFDSLASHNTEMIEAFRALAIETSKREKAMQSLYEQQQLLYDIIDNLPIFLALKDSTWKYIIVNRAFADLVDRHPRDIVGKTAAELPWESYEKAVFTESDKQLMQDGKTQITDEVITDSQGNEIPVIKIKKRFKDGILVFGIDKSKLCR